MNDNVTGAQLSDLYDIGAVYLSQIGEKYSEATTKVGGTKEFEGVLGGVFTLPSSAGVDTSAAFDDWEMLRNGLQQILYDSCNNTLDLGEVILKIMEAYREEDERNAGGIESAELGDHIKDRSNDSDGQDKAKDPRKVDRPNEPEGPSAVSPDSK